MAEYMEESPRSRFTRDLSIESMKQRGETGREQMRQAGDNTRTAASKYAAAMLEKDKKDYENVTKMYEGLSNVSGENRTMMEQTEGFKSMQKMFKRMQLPVFDNNGEFIWPASKTDQEVEVRGRIEKILQTIKEGRKLDPQDIGALNNARVAAADLGNDKEVQLLDKILQMAEQGVAKKQGVQVPEDDDPLGLGIQRK